MAKDDEKLYFHPDGLDLMNHMKDFKWSEKGSKPKKPMQIHYLKVEIKPHYYSGPLDNIMTVETRVESDIKQFTVTESIDICNFESTFSMLMDRAKIKIEYMVKEYQEGEQK